jgi:hypothetical protein
MKAKYSILLGCLAMMGFAFMSCSEDVYDNQAASKQLEAEYAANFVKKYGAIDPNQTWDFATMEPSFSLPSSGSSARTTRGENTGSYARTTGTMFIDKDVLDYVLKNLPKGNDNTPKGRSFNMKTTGNSFTIVPIFQGCASYYWELWMTVEGLGDEKIWAKGDNFKFRKAGTTDWSEPGTGKEGMKREYGTLEVEAPTFTYTNTSEGSDMSFYLKVWKTVDDLTGYDVYLKNLEHPTEKKYQPKQSSSLDNWMIDLQDATKPTNLPAGNEVTIIGCEDEITSGSDKDFEDLVFMVYGSPVPPTKRVEEVILSTTKRYMMEDLGDTDDFDFNDVVVDVSNRKKIQYIYNSLEATEWSDRKEEDLPQEAIVRAAGGTLNFTLTIGDLTWTKKDHLTPTQMLNTGWNGETINKDAELDKFEVSGWDPDANNVSVSVETRGNSGEVQTVVFPKAGEAPKIIAVDPTTSWMKERNEVPKTWFSE